MNRASPDDPGARPRPPGVQGGADRYEALLDVLEQQASRADHEPRAVAPAGRWKAPAAGLLLILTAWVWIAPPSWLVPPAPVPVPVVEEEAALRFRMYLQAQRIRAFEIARGRLPSTLAEAGEPATGMSYEVVAPRVYALTGVSERLRLTYRSDQSLADWVGTGAGLLEPELVP